MDPTTDVQVEPAVALATTKRKFHKLLDNLQASTSTPSLPSTLHESNASTASLHDPATPEPPSKRSRVSDIMAEQRTVSGGERIRALQEKLFTSQKSANATISSVRGPITTTTKTGTGTITVTPRKGGHYQPYSQEQFLGRLKTFAEVTKWPLKPDALVAVDWAKRGWVCVGFNLVACKGGCEQRVAVRLRPRKKDKQGKEVEGTEDHAVEVEGALVERFRALIVEGHAEDCLWRRRGCGDDIYHIPIADRAKSSIGMLERYQSLLSISQSLPTIDNILHPGPRIPEVVARIPSSFFNPPDSTSTSSPPQSASDFSAFAFALFGWHGLKEGNLSIATCHHCFMRIGLWLYDEEKLKASSERLGVAVELLRVNIMDSHREYCPWKNAQTQRNPSDGPIADMAAWETLEFIIMSRRKREKAKGPATATASAIDGADIEADLESYRPSTDTYAGSVDIGARDGNADKEGEGLTQKWKKFKAKLRRTASKKSLRSVKSVKSSKSGKEKGDQS